jgi:hypothetical protein
LTVGERLNKSLRAITQPVIEQLREIELEIATREQEMKELVEARRRLTAIARQIDPELAPKRVTHNGPKTPKHSISEEKVNELYEYLRQSKNGDEFYAAGLTKEGYHLANSQVSKALGVLHERGQIRLTRTGSGGSRYFKLVA